MKFTLILAVFCLIFLSYSSLTLAQGNSLRETEKRILDDILNPSKYDKRIRPNGDNSSNINGPVRTTVNFYIRGIESLSDEKSEIKMQLTFRLVWKDSRLAYQAPGLSYISLRDPSVLWVPDIFFSNERVSSRAGALHPSIMVRIFPDGYVLYSSIVTLTLACPHDYSLYPFDKPECQVKIASYGYTTSDMIVAWKENDPVQTYRWSVKQLLSIDRIKTEDCTSRTNTGEYSCIKASLRLNRSSNINLTRIYTPTTLLVIVSYLALWLKNPSHRLLLTSITLLVFTIDATLNEANRPSQLVTALDVWVGVCLTFSFASLLITVVLDYYNPLQGPCNRITANDIEKVEQNEQLAELNDEKTPQTSESTWLQKLKELRHTIPKDQEKLLLLIRLVYPLAFAVFTLFYMICVMCHSNEQ